MKLIELRGLYGPIWINPNYISSLSPHNYGANVFMANDTNPVWVKNEVEEILQLIYKAENE